MHQMQMHSFMLTEMFQKHFINACPWVNPIPTEKVHMPLGTPTPPGSPTKYSMYTYFILLEVNFQGLNIDPLAERAFNFPNMAFLNVSCMTVHA